MLELLEKMTDVSIGVIQQLFDEKPPLLVEVRFPKMATSSDWYLCEEYDEFKMIVGKLSKGVQVHLRSVHEIIAKGGIVFDL